MTDDTLDYLAEESQFGKTIGKDLQEGKLTLPLIVALLPMPEESAGGSSASSRR
jgi:octaprenyl-diphosphate synthase